MLYWYYNSKVILGVQPACYVCLYTLLRVDAHEVHTCFAFHTDHLYKSRFFFFIKYCIHP